MCIRDRYLEQFDSIFHIDASIKANTAYYYDKERLWKLIANVDIQNLKGERFNTELLYWNEATQKVYIHVSYQFPESFLVIVVGSIRFDTGFYMKDRIELFKIHSF